VEEERLSGGDPAARHALEARLYDRRLLQERLRHLQRVRARADVGDQMFAVRADLLRNLGNMTNPALHQRPLAVPQPIRDYIEEVKVQLRAIAAAPSVPLDDRLAFLRETRHAFGRTALVLSGGGSFGSFHLGVVKALLDASLLPRVVSGSSAGAVVASLICTRTDEELRALFSALPDGLQGIDFYSSNTAAQILRHLVLKGTLQDHGVLQERLQRLLGEMTFQVSGRRRGGGGGPEEQPMPRRCRVVLFELTAAPTATAPPPSPQDAYQRTGRILNVSVSAADTEEPPRLLNYLTAPNVIVWSAVACSSAFPFLFAPQQLLARDARGYVVSFANTAAGEAQRRWRDGSLEEDLPMRGLSEMFNVNYFLVSQANPYLLPIIAAKAAVPRTLGTLAEAEFKHRCKQTMELLPRWVGASRLLKLLSQPWEGDVTMVLPVATLSMIKAVVNLSVEDIMRALSEGQRAAWAKLSAISANCDIEVTLDSCLRQVTAAARRQRSRAERRASAAAALGGGAGGGGGGAGGAALLRRGMPSWLHLQSLGIPHSDSAEALGLPHSFSLEAMRAASALDLAGAGAPDGGDAAAGGFPRGVPSVRSAAALQVDLTDTAVPEDAELEAPEGEAGGGGGPTSPRHAPRPSFSCDDAAEVWRDLFQIAPATTSDALDFIAP
jgi:TAG lipase/steryl ester hydrolase/phospholipase A2/LPA acyltransferase